MPGPRPDFSLELLARHATQRIAQMILRCLSPPGIHWRSAPSQPGRPRGTEDLALVALVPAPVPPVLLASIFDIRRK
jgi:hypothetical protein